jgi:uncharacterized membrane protein YjfL (UPF0719 family)
MTVLLTGVVTSLTYGLVGIVLLLIGYFAFEIATRKIDVQDQLNKGNTAVAIVVAALLLGIAYIAGLVVHG